MDCSRFQRDLAAYLSGRLSPAAFDALAEHEAHCPACAGRAAEAMDDSPAPDSQAPLVQDAWLRELLARTAGRDCRAVQRILAERMDGPAGPDLERLAAEHTRACPSCAAIAGALRDLPALYAACPRLRAGREFTHAVLARTSRTAPGFLETLGAMVRRPAVVWESALVCALLTSPFLGQPLQRVTETMQAGPLAVPATIARGAWDSLDAGLSQTQARLAGMPASRAVTAGRWQALRRAFAKRLDALAGPGTLVRGRIADARTWLRLFFHMETIDRGTGAARAAPGAGAGRDTTGASEEFEAPTR